MKPRGMETLDKTVIDLLDEFEESGNLSLEAFRVIWSRRRFAEVHHLVEVFYGQFGQSKCALEDSRRFLLEQVFLTIEKILIIPGLSLSHKAGAIYCLWAVHQTQTLSPKERIPMTSNGLRAALDIARELDSAKRDDSFRQNDVRKVLSTLFVDDSLRFCTPQAWVKLMKRFKRAEQSMPSVPKTPSTDLFLATNIDEIETGLLESELTKLKEMQCEHRNMARNLQLSQRSWFDICDGNAKRSSTSRCDNLKSLIELKGAAYRSPWMPRFGPRRPIPREGLVLLGFTSRQDECDSQRKVRRGPNAVRFVASGRGSNLHEIRRPREPSFTCSSGDHSLSDESGDSEEANEFAKSLGQDREQDFEKIIEDVSGMLSAGSLLKGLKTASNTTSRAGNTESVVVPSKRPLNTRGNSGPDAPETGHSPNSGLH